MPVPHASDATPAVVRLRPIRSLVLVDGRAYRERALRVLGELGPVAFASVRRAGCDAPADVAALIGHERPDVVVLDASGCEAAVATVIRALAAAPATAAVGVVVVCEQSNAAARRLGAGPKWGWTQDLRRAVEAASLQGPRLPEGVAVEHPPRPAGALAGWVQDGPPRPGS